MEKIKLDGLESAYMVSAFLSQINTLEKNIVMGMHKQKFKKETTEIPTEVTDYNIDCLLNLMKKAESVFEFNEYNFNKIKKTLLQIPRKNKTQQE